MEKKVKKDIKSRLIFAFAFMVLIICAYAFTRSSRTDEKKYELSDDLKLTFSNADDVVEALRTSLKNHDVKINITCTSKEDHLDDVDELVEELMQCALYASGDPTGGDYIRYQYGGYTYTYDNRQTDGGYDYTISIVPQYYTDLEEEEEVDAKVKEILEETDFGFVSSDLQRVQKIYDYIYENVSYDTVRKNHDGYHKKSTAYAALVQNTAVCQGYAVAMFRLLEEVGVDCRVVTGIATYEGESEYHAWNIVRIDGQYYNLDVTWDKELGNHDCFLKTDADLSGHERDEEFSSEEFYGKYPMAEMSYEYQE